MPSQSPAAGVHGSAGDQSGYTGRPTLLSRTLVKTAPPAVASRVLRSNSSPLSDFTTAPAGTVIVVPAIIWTRPGAYHPSVPGAAAVAAVGVTHRTSPSNH